MTAYAALAAFQDVVVLLNASLLTALVAFIVVKCLYNFGLVIAWIFAAVLLFTHKRLYPRFFVALLVIMFIGTVLDLAVTAMAFDVTIDSSDVRSTLRFVIGAGDLGSLYVQIGAREEHLRGGLSLAQRPTSFIAPS